MQVFNHLDIKTTNSSCPQYCRGWLYLFVKFSLWYHSKHAVNWRNQAPWFSCPVHITICLLQSFWRQLKHIWTCQASKDEITHKAHCSVGNHHFREHVHHGKVRTFPNDTNDKPAEIAAKAVPQDSFTCHCNQICRGYSTCWERVLECDATLYYNTSSVLVLVLEEGAEWPSHVGMTLILKKLQ